MLITRPPKKRRPASERKVVANLAGQDVFMVVLLRFYSHSTETQPSLRTPADIKTNSEELQKFDK
jgi:hypothetical protein